MVKHTTASDDGRVTRLRLGAALGCAGGPAAGFGAAWSGLGDARLHVWILATLLGALLGALAWPVFVREREAIERPGVGFAALFGGCVSLLAGVLAAFPVGALVGAFSGAVGAAVAALMWRACPQLGSVQRPAAAACVGAGVGLLVAMGWTT